MAEFKISRAKTEALLSNCLGKTLEEIDVNDVFELARRNPLIKGIAGDVIEQSVFGMPKDSEQKPDLVIDDIPTELKTTGTKYKGTKTNKYLGAKEPITITNVSPNTLVDEALEDSAFWHKIAHILFVFYFYSSNRTVSSYEYRFFKINGYNFFEFTDEEIKTLKNDWSIVQRRAREIKSHADGKKLLSKDYGSLTKCRHQTMMINICSPSSLRFRLNAKVGDMIVKRCMNKELYSLPENYTNYHELEAKLRRLSSHYQNEVVSDLIRKFELEKVNTKGIGEAVIAKMFDAPTVSMNKIDLFLRSGIVGKTIVLTKTGSRTEDMKLFPIDFEEIADTSITWDDSSFKSYFTENRLLCILFEEPSKDAPLNENVFKGFKMYSLTDYVVDTVCRNVFEKIRELVVNHTLKDIVSYDKNGRPVINKTGVIKSAPNFPKSKDFDVFVRGDSSDSTNKPLEVNGIKMYNQYIWIKGSFIANELKSIEVI